MNDLDTKGKETNMRKTIKLTELDHIDNPVSDEYTPEEIADARETMKRRNLRFSNKTGIVRDNDVGILAEYVDQSDFEPYDNEQDVFDWEFKKEILSVCHRRRWRESNEQR